jgi:hypothetical protein
MNKIGVGSNYMQGHCINQCHIINLHKGSATGSATSIRLIVLKLCSLELYSVKCLYGLAVGIVSVFI